MNLFLLLKKYLPLTFTSTILGAIASACWYFFPQSWLYDSQENGHGIENALNVVFISHTLIATLLTDKLHTKSLNISQAIRQKNEERVKHLTASVISEPIELLLLIFSVAIVGLTILGPADSTPVGIIFSFAGTYIVSLWWSILHELDDPFKGICSIPYPDTSKWLDVTK